MVWEAEFEQLGLTFEAKIRGHLPGGPIEESYTLTSDFDEAVSKLTEAFGEPRALGGDESWNPRILEWSDQNHRAGYPRLVGLRRPPEYQPVRYRDGRPWHDYGNTTGFMYVKQVLVERHPPPQLPPSTPPPPQLPPSAPPPPGLPPIKEPTKGWTRIFRARQ